jgi:hypothetical protein
MSDAWRGMSGWLRVGFISHLYIFCCWVEVEKARYCAANPRQTFKAGRATRGVALAAGYAVVNFARINGSDVGLVPAQASYAGTVCLVVTKQL